MFEPDWRQPEPPGVKPVKSRNPWLPVIALGVVLALIVLALWVPIPIFWRELPGPVRDVEQLITVEGAPEYTSEGALYLTTVSFDDEVTFAEWIMSGFDDETVVVLKDDVTGGGSTEELLKAAREQMLQSKEDARNVALSELGMLQPSARISRVEEGSPAAGKIEVGDVVISVAGVPTYQVCEVGLAVREQGVDEEISVVVERDGRRRTLQMSTEALDPSQPETPMIGIVMKQTEALAPEAPDVKIDTGAIGGPSAGLIFSLAIYDRLTPDDITKGREIAGTGGIACDGTVQPIGGIERKVAAAENEGAEIFLAPAEDSAAAEAVAQDIEVVSVGTFDEAVEYLAGLS